MPVRSLIGSNGVERMWRSSDVARTPQDLFSVLDAEFHFTLDVCANEENHQCAEWFGGRENGLWQAWSGVCWCNPPYSDIARWIQKAWLARGEGVTTVLLLPVRTDVGWWHDFALDADEIRFIRGRLRFNGMRVGAPFPSCLVIFRAGQAPASSEDMAS